ncbi:hypothetical protein HK102_014035 [Quaeritorhiza haematococci]|nr:hypothetical protein HK102_014035 [Quaeritorhiza haematococci]
MVKAFLAPETLQRVVILGKDYKTTLTKYIDLDNLPQRYGGNKIDINDLPQVVMPPHPHSYGYSHHPHTIPFIAHLEHNEPPASSAPNTVSGKGFLHRSPEKIFNHPAKRVALTGAFKTAVAVGVEDDNGYDEEMRCEAPGYPPLLPESEYEEVFRMEEDDMHCDRTGHAPPVGMGSTLETMGIYPPAPPPSPSLSFAYSSPSSFPSSINSITGPYFSTSLGKKFAGGVSVKGIDWKGVDWGDFEKRLQQDSSPWELDELEGEGEWGYQEMLRMEQSY